MSVKSLFSTNMGLPVLRPRVIYLATDPTPGTIISMKPQTAGSVSTDAVGVPVSVPSSGGTVTMNLATYVSTKPHSVVAGQAIHVAGASHTQFNGDFTVFAVVDDKTFTYYIPVGAGAVTDASVTCTFTVHFQRALILNAGASTVTFGPNSAADYADIGAGVEYKAEAPGGAKLDLADYYFQSAGISQAVRVSII